MVTNEWANAIETGKLFYIFVQIPLERGENIVLAFCEKLTKATDLPLIKVCLQS